MELSEFIASCQKGINGNVTVNIFVSGNVTAANLTVNRMTVGGKSVGKTGDGKVKKNKPKIVNTTFRYRWLEQHPERIGFLYQALLRAKTDGKNNGWIAKETKPDDFSILFSGKPTSVKVRWSGTKQHLKYLFKLLIEREYIYAANGSRQPWVIVQSHLVPSLGETFSDWDREKMPKEYRHAIEAMAEILNPDLSIEEIVRMLNDKC